jgi:CRP-like cAMP-binding protein
MAPTTTSRFASATAARPASVVNARPAYLRPVPAASSREAVSAELERIGSTVAYRRGQMLVEEGNPAEYVFRVVSGALRSVRLLPDGRRYITNFLLPGDFFGLADVETYTQSVEAVADAKIVRYSRNAFQALLERDPRAGRHFLELVCGELSAAQERLLLLGRKNAMERIATFLLTMADRTKASEIDLPMNRSDVADYLGLTVETVSRLLTQLRGSRVIELPTANHIRVRNRDALKGISTAA